MRTGIEIWFNSPPAPAAIALALARFGALRELRGGGLRLVGGGQAPHPVVPLRLIERATPPAAVLACLPRARAVLRVSPAQSGARDAWLWRIAAEVQRRLGGLIHLPVSGAVWPDGEAFESAWPGEPDDPA